MISCNHDCLNFPYPDVPKECLDRPLSYAEYRELDWIDSNIINEKTYAEKKAAAYRKAYYEANQKKLSDQQECISYVRKSYRMTQCQLAMMIGTSRKAVSNWETGVAPANWDKLCAVLPELEEYISK